MRMWNRNWWRKARRKGAEEDIKKETSTGAIKKYDWDRT